MSKKTSLLAGVLVGLASAASRADDVMIFTSSPNPVGSGARATGMGRAFIGVADDATAASWNPGGLIQLERPEISAVGAYTTRTEEWWPTQPDDPYGDVKFTNDYWDLNYASAAYPFEVLSRNLVISMNLQRLYDFRGGFDIPIQDEIVDRMEYKQVGGMYAMSPCVAFQAIPQLSVGATVNFWDSDIVEAGWKTNMHQSGTGTIYGFPYVMDYRETQEYDISGQNFHVGLMYEPISWLKVGAVVKTPLDADMEYTRYTRTYEALTTLGESLETVESVHENRELHMPWCYGLGVSGRIGDAWTVDADVYRTEWSGFEMVDGEGTEISPVTGLESSESDVDAATSVRVGTEYLFILKSLTIPARCGVFYDPEPSDHNPLDSYGFSLGSGIAVGPVVFDAAYEYKWLHDDSIGAEAETQKILASCIFHF